MKNLYTKREFLNHLEDAQPINEGLLKKLWQSVRKLANKIKGSGEINKKYEEFVKMIDDVFNKFLNVETSKIGESLLIEADATEGTATTGENPGEVTETEAKPEEAANLANLKPEQIKHLSGEIRKRVDELKGQFEADVNSIIERLSKNKDYSSEKLKQFATVMKRKLQNYVYDKWYNYYTKVGDKKTLLKITQLKKQNDADYKKAVDELNTKISEQQGEVAVEAGKEYTYKNSEGKDITVNVIGTGKGLDETGKKDTSKPEYENMWKVKTGDDKTFWVSPGSLSKSPGKLASAVDKDDIKVGGKYTFISKKTDEPVIATIATNKDGKTFSDDGGDVYVTTPGNPTGFMIPIDRLKPTK